MRLFTFFLLNLIIFSAFSQKDITSFSSSQNAILFHENKGQVSDQNFKPRNDVLFSLAKKDLVIFFRNNGYIYQFYNVETKKQPDVDTSASFILNLKKREMKVNTYRLDVEWLNCNINASIQKENPDDAYCNYYLQSCPDGALNVRSYADVTYKNIYNRIDLKYYNKDGNLKYDYIVQPNTDYKQIQFKISGAQKISINKKGELVIETPVGQINEARPLVIQNGKVLKSGWKITNSNIISFEVFGINKTQAFVIDPLVRFWGTHYGGSGGDSFVSIDTDNNNNVCAYGMTSSPSTTLIATTGAHQTIYGGNYDVQLVKFNSNGVRLWSTYYGGSGNDGFQISKGCALDLQNNIFITGITESTVAIASAGAHQPLHGGALGDAFLVKFNSAGVRQWGTYYGGTQTDEGRACSVDATGNVFMVGTTESSNINVISTAGSQQLSYGGGTNGDAFLVKFNNAGVRQWGTYYGGNSNDFGFGTSTDINGNVYMCGVAGSYGAGLIATLASHQQACNGPANAYLVKFSPSGLRLWGTYYGGNPGTGATDCVTDGSNNIYLTGQTETVGGNIISTAGSHQSNYGGNHDAFLVKFNSLGQRVWGTYYGGYQVEFGFSCAVDLEKNVYLAGQTWGNSIDSIASPSAYQYAFGGGTVAIDAFLVKFDSSGTRKWGTFYGGNSDESGNSCTVSQQGHIYLAGATSFNTGTVIASPGSHQYLHGGSGDGFLVQFFDCGTQVDATITGQNNGCFGANNGSATVTATGGGIYTFTWLPVGGNMATVTNLGNGTYTVYVNSVCGNTTQILTIVQPTAALSVTASTSNSLICLGNSATISASASGGTAPYTYTWSSGPTNTLVIINPAVTTNYSVTLKDANGCVDTKTLTQSVAQLPSVFITSNDSMICRGEIATLTGNGANSYVWSTGGVNTTEVVSPTVTITYSVTGTDVNSCSNLAVFTQSVADCLGMEKNAEDNLELNIYPNPSNGIFFVSGNTDHKKLEIEIVDVNGKLLLKDVFYNEIKLIYLTQYAKGIYHINVYDQGELRLNKKISVE